jgi:hypothetical protein
VPIVLLAMWPIGEAVIGSCALTLSLFWTLLAWDQTEAARRGGQRKSGQPFAPTRSTWRRRGSGAAVPRVVRTLSEVLIEGCAVS